MTITSEMRVRAALALDVTDRPPVSLWGHEFDKEWFTNSLADSTVDRAQRLGLDWVKVQFRATVFAEAVGAWYQPDPSGLVEPIQRKPAVSNVDDWNLVIERALAPVLPDVFEDQLAVLRRVLMATSSTTPVVHTIFSPISICHYLVRGGMPEVQAWFQSHPQLMSRVLEALGTMMARYGSAAIENGASGVLYGTLPGYASPKLMSSNEYADVVLPSDLISLDGTTAGWFNTVHFCADSIFFEHIKQMPVQAVNWEDRGSGNLSLSEAREFLQIAVMGGLDRYAALRDGTAADVAAEVASVFERCSTPGLMVSPNCSVSPLPTEKEENFVALVSAVKAQSTQAG